MSDTFEDKINARWTDVGRRNRDDVAALRASHERLLAVLDMIAGRVNGERCWCFDELPMKGHCHACREARAAIAEARKIEG